MSLYTKILVFIFSSAVIFAQQSGHEPPAEFNLGVQLFQSGDYEGAIELWQKATDKDTALAAAWFNMAIAYDIMRRDSAAISCYHRAAQLRPYDPDPWIYLAQLHRRRQEPYPAAQAYQKAVALKPDDPELLNGLAIAYDQLEEYSPAINALNRALMLDSLYISAWVNKITVHNHMGQYDSAAYYGEKVADMFPDEAVTWAQLGLAYHNLGRNNDAMFALDSAIAIFNDLAMAHYYRSLVLLAIGNKAEAMEELQIAIELYEPYRDMAEEDSEFDSIRDTQEFRKLIESK